MISGNWRLAARFLLTVILVLASVLAAVAPAGAAPASPASDRAYAPDSLLVRFATDTPAGERALARAAVQANLVHEYDLVPGLEQLRLPVDKIGVEKAVAILSHRPGVLYAEPDYELQLADTTPNDPSYGNLWGMGNIKAPQAWDVTTGSATMVVAVIDTGVQYTHPDLAANIWRNTDEIAGNGLDDDHNGYVDDVYGWDFGNNDADPKDRNGHGTHVAGTIGAVGNNGVGVAGVNWTVKVMPVKFFADSGTGYTSSAVKGLQYAVNNGAQISNNSYTGGNYTPLRDAIANASGHLFVAAAGNASKNADLSPEYPAAYNLANIISVAAIGSNDALASFSNYGATSVDLAAPGVSIQSTVPTNKYAYYSGTSMASPHVAGAAALVWGANAGLSMSQVRDRLLTNARKVSGLTDKVATGGTLDVAAALGTTPPSDTTPPAAPTGLSATAGSGQVTLDWADNGEGDLAGYKVYRSTTSGTGYAEIASLGKTSAYTDTSAVSGTYYYVVTALDTSNNESGYSNEVFATLASDGINLSVRAYKVRNVKYADPSWSGAASSNVDVYRDGSKVATTANDGAYTDGPLVKTIRSATYKVCEAGTTTCSNEVTVTW